MEQLTNVCYPHPGGDEGLNIYDCCHQYYQCELFQNRQQTNKSGTKHNLYSLPKCGINQLIFWWNWTFAISLWVNPKQSGFLCRAQFGKITTGVGLETHSISAMTTMATLLSPRPSLPSVVTFIIHRKSPAQNPHPPKNPYTSWKWINLSLWNTDPYNATPIR